MGLKATIANAVASGFSAIGDVKVTATYTQITKGTYNPVTGNSPPTETTYTITDTVFYSARDREIDGIKILVNDRRLMFQQTSLPITPSQDDKIIVDGRNYNIVNIIEDPAQATWTLFIRGV